MKKILLIILPLFFLFSLTECKKKTYTLDPPVSKVEGVNGTWELYSVVQVDELDLAKAERNISNFYIDQNSTNVLQITFKSSDMTFEVVLGDIGRNYLPTSGSWYFDDDNYPEYIYLEDEDGNSTELSLQGPTRPQDNQLKYSFKRSCVIDGVEEEYVGYRYEFNRK